MSSCAHVLFSCDDDYDGVDGADDYMLRMMMIFLSCHIERYQHE